jgi:predicted porin
MDSGNSTGSRWGLKGTEDLGNGYKVGFVLESGFSSDTGKGSDDGLFNRESSLFVSGPFGTVYAGRLNSLISDAGSIGWYGGMASPFGTGWGEIAGHAEVFVTQSRFNNTIAYMSPRFAGLQLSAQYSMGDDGAENKPSSNRYAAIGADYQAGNLEVGFLVDYLNKNSSNIDGSKLDDAYTVNLAANYDFGVVKAFAAAQYFKNTLKMGKWTHTHATRLTAYEGFGVNLGADVPLAGGNLMASIGYADADGDEAKERALDGKVYTALVGYSYPFSKRTSVYVGGGFTKVHQDFKEEGTTRAKAETYQVMTGLVHKF